MMRFPVPACTLLGHLLALTQHLLRVAPVMSALAMASFVHAGEPAPQDVSLKLEIVEGVPFLTGDFGEHATGQFVFGGALDDRPLVDVNVGGALVAHGLAEVLEELQVPSSVESLRRGYLYRLKQLRFGSVENRQVEAMGVYCASESLLFGIPITGEVSAGFLGGRIVHLNYETQTLTLMSQVPPNVAQRASVVAMDITALPSLEEKKHAYKKEMPIVEMSINGLPARRFVVQPSFHGTIAIASAKLTKDLLGPEGALPDTETCFTWLSIPARCPLFRLKSARIADITIEEPICLLLDPDYREHLKNTEEDSEPVGMIGGGLLRRFNVTFDYMEGRLYLEPNSHMAIRDEADMSGMVLMRLCEKTGVMHVNPNTPAAEAGVMRGDELIKIDGQSTEAMSLERIRQLFTSRDRAVRRIQMQRNGQVRDVEIILRRAL